MQAMCCADGVACKGTGWVQAQERTLSLILALWQNWRKGLELTSISPRVADDLCAMTLGFRLQPPLLKVVSAEPAQGGKVK